MMPEHRNMNDSLVAEKIYCVFERNTPPGRASTEGRHNAQHMTIDGNPATAIIKRKLRINEKYIKLG
jgi:hypothetical protein